MNMSTHRLSRGGACAVPLLPLVLVVALTACTGPRTGLWGRSGLISAANGSDSNSNSGDSGSANSANSSGDSAKSSGNSANGSNNSSAATNNSGNNSAQSSNQSSAQSSKDSTAQSSKSSGIVLSATVLAGTVIGVGALIWNSVVVGKAAAAAAAAAQTAQLFLRANAHQLEQDLALGGGQSIEDLAAMAEIQPEHLTRFGRLLREHRAELLSLARPSALTPERAAEFMQQIGGLARADAALAADGEAFLARHPGGD
jgi:hypothetical protein